MESYKVTAPTRADLAGGTLDLWPLYTLVGEAKTINVALSLHAIAIFEVSSARQFQIEVKSASGESFVIHEPVNRAQVQKLHASLQFPVTIVSEYLRNKPEYPKYSVRLSIQAEAPLRSGLGGSSTLCVAMARGLARLFGDFIEQGWQWKMLEWVRDLEAGYLNTPTGTQDYLAAFFGGLQCYRYRIGGVDNTPYSEKAFAGLSERLLVLFSGEMHHSGISNWELFKQAMEQKKPIIQGLTEIKGVADHLDSELQAGNIGWKKVGQLLNEEWRVRKELFGVHTDRLEEILAFLHQKKVLGAKVCGAASGGSILALVDPEQREAVARACTEKGIQVLRTAPVKAGVSISVD